MKLIEIRGDPVATRILLGDQVSRGYFGIEVYSIEQLVCFYPGTSPRLCSVSSTYGNSRSGILIHLLSAKPSRMSTLDWLYRFQA